MPILVAMPLVRPATPIGTPDPKSRSYPMGRPTPCSCWPSSRRDAEREAAAGGAATDAGRRRRGVDGRGRVEAVRRRRRRHRPAPQVLDSGNGAVLGGRRGTTAPMSSQRDIGTSTRRVGRQRSAGVAAGEGHRGVETEQDGRAGRRGWVRTRCDPRPRGGRGAGVRYADARSHARRGRGSDAETGVAAQTGAATAEGPAAVGTDTSGAGACTETGVRRGRREAADMRHDGHGDADAGRW
ncbi:hypothetical protein B0H14DRAFT_148876 [Mycena olivaceomarginata]|nr:hypothetical protein B0H14DRAFT_148876 [Mycena olivaceomarginata]